MADFDFEHTLAWNGAEVSTLNLDHAGHVHEYGTVGTWQFECYERDHEHQAYLANLGELYARANRTDKDFYWCCDYVSSETMLQGIATGFGDSFEDCEQAFMELWPQIRKHKVCSWALPDKFHHYCKDKFTYDVGRVA